MWKRRTLIAVMCCLALRSAAMLRQRATILVVSSSAQQRPVVPIACDSCDTLDIAQGGRSNTGYPVVVIDGHSVPGIHLLGKREDQVLQLIARVQPRVVILATCYGAEIGLLEKIFESARSVETIVGAASTLPWRGYSVDERCVQEHGPMVACFKLPAEVRVFSRDDVRQFHSRAEQLLAEIKSCKRLPPLVRVYPHYLCLENPRGGALYQIEFEAMVNGCPRSDPDTPVVHCSREPAEIGSSHPITPWALTRSAPP